MSEEVGWRSDIDPPPGKPLQHLHRQGITEPCVQFIPIIQQRPLDACMGVVTSIYFRSGAGNGDGGTDGFRSYIRIPEELVLFLGWRRWWRWLDDVRGFRRHAFYTLCWVRFCFVDHGRYFFGGGGGGGGGLTAVGGFGVTPSCTLIFLTNFIRGGGCWFVMVLLRMFTDIICR